MFFCSKLLYMYIGETDVDYQNNDKPSPEHKLFNTFNICHRRSLTFIIIVLITHYEIFFFFTLFILNSKLYTDY